MVAGILASRPPEAASWGSRAAAAAGHDDGAGWSVAGRAGRLTTVVRGGGASGSDSPSSHDARRRTTSRSSPSYPATPARCVRRSCSTASACDSRPAISLRRLASWPSTRATSAVTTSVGTTASPHAGAPLSGVALARTGGSGGSGATRAREQSTEVLEMVLELLELPHRPRRWGGGSVGAVACTPVPVRGVEDDPFPDVAFEGVEPAHRLRGRFEPGASPVQGGLQFGTCGRRPLQVPLHRGATESATDVEALPDSGPRHQLCAVVASSNEPPAAVAERCLPPSRADGRDGEAQPNLPLT